ncbi:hypothetical protein SUGI_0183230 [Cryptomeria japonica]|nr:hypothetical protein SUGI_0183230 [Cryptomeria japonica]
MQSNHSHTRPRRHFSLSTPPIDLNPTLSTVEESQQLYTPQNQIFWARWSRTFLIKLLGIRSCFLRSLQLAQLQMELQGVYSNLLHSFTINSLNFLRKLLFKI